MKIVLALLVLVGLIAVGYVLFRRLNETQTVVITVDSDGTELRREMVVDPTPDRIDRNGLLRFGDYFGRLTASRARFSSVIASSFSGDRAFLVMKENGVVSVSLSIDWRSDPEKERRARRMFKELGIPPTEDYLAGNGGISDATRYLQFPLPANTLRAKSICLRVMREIEEIQPEEGLNYTFEENDGRQN